STANAVSSGGKGDVNCAGLPDAQTRPAIVGLSKIATRRDARDGKRRSAPIGKGHALFRASRVNSLIRKFQRTKSESRDGLVDENGDFASPEIGQSHIERAIAVEVRCFHKVHSVAHTRNRILDMPLEGAVTVAKQNGHDIAALAGECQVRLAILIKVAHHGRFRITDRGNLKSQSLLKGPVAVTYGD